jgi:hypothetical protein
MAQLKLYKGSSLNPLPLQLDPGAVYVLDSGTAENEVFHFGDMYVDLDTTRLHIGGSQDTIKKSDYIPGLPAALTTQTVTIPNVTSVGTLPSLTTTSFEIPNISVENVSVVSDIDIEQGEASCSLVATESDNQVESTDYCLNLSNQQPITDITKTTASIGSASEGAAFDIDGVDTWSEGTTPSLGTDITVKEVDS